MPQFVMDYIIIHELCHIKQMNHSKEFWKLVESHCPNYKESKYWLKEKWSYVNEVNIAPFLRINLYFYI